MLLREDNGSETVFALAPENGPERGVMEGDTEALRLDRDGPGSDRHAGSAIPQIGDLFLVALG